MASKKFTRLERTVEAEYRRKGYSLPRARYIGKAVAGEVAHRKRNPSPPRDAKGRYVSRRRRNPSRKAAPSHDLFGERNYQESLFGSRKYEAVPKPKAKERERKGKAANSQQGRLDIFGTRGLFD